MIRLIISALIVFCLISPALADTGVIFGVREQAGATTCKEHIQAVAQVVDLFWGTANLEATQIEGYLPSVNTPCEFQPGVAVYWARARMPDGYADSLAEMLVAHYAEYSGLLYSVIIMRPDAEGNLPEEPSWTVDVTDPETEDVIGQRTVYVGRIR